MDLWIKTQDKECLMKINRVDYDVANGEHRIIVNGYKTLVGKYETKERALEVLDEIQDNLIMTHTTNKVGYNNVVFYSMPEE